MEFSDLFKKRVECEVTFDDQKLKFSYNPRKVTPEFNADFQSMVKTDEQKALARAISEVVVDWDLKDKGKPYPLKFEAVSKLPTEFLAALMIAINEENHPNRTSSATDA